ncbi:nucleotidyltransferase family protein [Kocuria palustris]|uniref:nucleotidyltransferase family protein n=1 Tax=Kocuria palustris TaxID=71999 RepID=UPI0011A2C9E8|nr:nucleotidyltransferase family protein [Kocuria palustris]
MAAESPLPPEVRVRFAHAMISHVLRAAGIRGLHHKGHTAPAGTYRAGRSSSDADVLVPAADARRAVAALEQRGWELVADYEDGSIFKHAASLWHSHLGYADIHRLLPGVEAPAEEVFERLWRHRAAESMGGRECNVPERLDHIALIVIHAARDAERGAQDVAHLRSILSDDEWEQVRSRALELDAAAAWAVATEETVTAPLNQVELLRALHTGADRPSLLRARLHAAESRADRARIALGALVPNRAHLRVQLRREPALPDYLREYRARIAAALRGPQRRGRR